MYKICSSMFLMSTIHLNELVFTESPCVSVTTLDTHYAE